MTSGGPLETIQMMQAVFFETLEIIIFVTLMMIFVEWIQVNFKEKIQKLIVAKTSNQIVGSSLLGVIPGCFDAFFIVSLYTHGLVGFGALVAVMLATAGDEAFFMFAMLPLETTLLIFSFCFVFGVFGGFLAERIAGRVGLRRSIPCAIEIHPKKEKKRRHFLKEHIYEHIILKHIPKLFLWIFFTLLAVEFLIENFDLETILLANMPFMMIVAALVGIIPGSGPHLLFLTFFVRGMVPFSVLLTNTLVQDGHGLLPLLSYSPRDTITVKLFNVIFGLLIGSTLFSIGF